LGAGRRIWKEGSRESVEIALVLEALDNPKPSDSDDFHDSTEHGRCPHPAARQRRTGVELVDSGD
jgi:hypothetical protein